MSQAPKTVQNNPLLNAIGQLLALDETALLLALAEREGVTLAGFARKALRMYMKTASKSVTVQTDPTLTALAQLLGPDEATLFALVVKQDGGKPKKALREAFGLYVQTTLDNCLCEPAHKAFNRAVYPITKKLGWRREEFGYKIPGVA